MMNNQHKNRIIKKLGDLLPPFTEAVISLMDYIKDGKETNEEFIRKLVEVTGFSRKLSDALGEEIDVIQNSLVKLKVENAQLIKTYKNKVIKEEKILQINAELKIIEDSILEIGRIQGIAHRADDLIGKGIYTLIYLIAEEKNILDKFEKVADFVEFNSSLDKPSVEQAIDSLYKGSKELVALIDMILEES